MEIRNRIQVLQGDITRQKVDAIVNASNATLLPRAGVSKAVHGQAGHRLTYECAKLGGCQAGQAKITPGFRLDAKWVIHTVGPKWEDGNQNEAQLLASCYARSMELAAQVGAKSIAFPSIATGILGFPLRPASAIAMRTVIEQLERYPSIEKVIFALYTESQLNMYQAALDELFVPRSFNTVGTATVWAPQ
jgi:O-acetyl-ADP-ribose deacetylase (regulator of RNase III)